MKSKSNASLGGSSDHSYQSGFSLNIYTKKQTKRTEETVYQDVPMGCIKTKWNKCHTHHPFEWGGGGIKIIIIYL